MKFSNQFRELRKTLEDSLDKTQKQLQELAKDNPLSWKQINKALENIKEVTKPDGKPIILLTGRTGVGKSALINAIFGQELADTGAGRPITSDFKLYSDFNIPLMIFDSAGWEGGNDNHIEYQKTMRDFLKTERERLRVIWYAVDAPSARFTEHDAAVIQDVFGKLPVMILLTKSDIASEEQLLEMMKAILEARLKNVFAVVELTTNTHQLTDEEKERFSHIEAVEKTLNFLKN